MSCRLSPRLSRGTVPESPPAFAVQPDEVLKDPAMEARAREISKELRCLVCQNQSIDDSNAPLARDLRVLVRERLVAGDDNTRRAGLYHRALRRLRPAAPALQGQHLCAMDRAGGRAAAGRVGSGAVPARPQPRRHGWRYRGSADTRGTHAARPAAARGYLKICCSGSSPPR